MSAPTGNTNASRWTKEKTNRILDQIEQLGWDESIHTLTQALLKVKCYKQIWSYWKTIWELDGDMMDRIYYIESLYIHKLEEGALFRKLNPSACFFILRHNYGYNTKGENELPSHLRADLEEAMTETPQPADSTPTKVTKEHASTKPTTTKAPTMDFHHLDLQVKKNPQLYANQKKSGALM